jgi:hypothetical protein
MTLKINNINKRIIHIQNQQQIKIKLILIFR